MSKFLKLQQAKVNDEGKAVAYDNGFVYVKPETILGAHSQIDRYDVAVKGCFVVMTENGGFSVYGDLHSFMEQLESESFKQ